MLSRFISYIVLPPEVTRFERDYLKKVNRIALAFFLCHPPIFMAVAALAGTGVLSALWMSAVVLLGPVLAVTRIDNPRTVSMVHGVTAMLMGGLLVHFGQGQVQIEMHFYFFVLLALLAVTANPLVVCAAAVTAALHHALLYFLLPSSVFNYDAQLWVVGVHALFVVLESVAAVFVARSFFDNVIGLEKIVAARTEALDARNADMRLLLDNVDQGFLTIDRDGVLARERSAVVETWFGPMEADETWSAYIARTSEDVAAWFDLAWESLMDGFMPHEVSLDQMPKRLDLGDRHFAFDYKPLFDDQDELRRLLIVVNDITADVERERAEASQREMMGVFDRVLRDRAGFLEFFEEASRLVDEITEQAPEHAVAKRLIHTLKGNCGLFGVSSVAGLCHVIEQQMIDEERDLTDDERATLQDAWAELAARLGALLGEGDDNLEIDESDYDALFNALVRRAPRLEVAKMVARWKCEPMKKRLHRVAEQATALAGRLGKGTIVVHTEDHGVRLPREAWAPFWSAFAHVIRNAVDHGLERPEDRADLDKPGTGQLWVKTFYEGHDFIVELADDGRGIDWDKIRQKAADKGLAHETRADLERALFAEGLSTAAQTTSVSGRGVGMAAVREACFELGGFVEIDSEPGEGTTWRFRFAREATEYRPDLTRWGIGSFSQFKPTGVPQTICIN